METEVIVVGAGPVGLMLAGELRLGGAEVVVLERLSEPTGESRASTLHSRTMEILDQRGLLDRLDTTPPNQRSGHFGGLPLDLGCLPTPFPGQWKVPQTRVEALLGARADDLGADIRRGHRLCGLDSGADHVRARVQGPAGPYELTGRYLVGCDGEDSTVRRLAGVDFPGSDGSTRLLRADVAGIRVPDRRFERLPAGLAISARGPDGTTRLMVAEYHRPPGRGAAPPTFAELSRCWYRVTGEDVSGGTPVWLNAFDDACRQAAVYRAGPVLLAGDAAHRQLPAGGQAINLGIQDAANLGWKLAATVTGRAADGLLDTYHTERHATGRRTLGNIASQALLLLDPGSDPLREVLRELIGYPPVRDQLAGMISGLDVRYARADHPLVGVRMPPVDLPSVDGAAGAAALLRAGRAVLLNRSPGPERHARLAALTAGWARSVGLVSTDRPGPRTTTDRPGPRPAAHVAGGRATADVTAGPATVHVPDDQTTADLPATLLLRPDGYVAWVGDDRSDPVPALREWFRPTRP